jgi:hypothetical protein
MSTLILDVPRLSSLSKGWIISKREDLIWFIGSSLLGYVALAALVSGLPVATTFLLWMLFIDGPHVFATTSRTYLDKTARGRLGWRLWLIVPLTLIGPAMWLMGVGGLFGILLVTWAQYHVAKQHFGLLMLYKRKTGERSDFQLDRRFLLGSMMVPWFLYVLTILQVRFTGAVWAAMGSGLCLLYAAHQIRKALSGDSLNLSKLLLLSVVIPLQWMAFFYASTHGPNGILVAAIAVNIGHSLQYQRLTWFHNQNRYAGETRSTIGFASFVNSKLSVYLLTALALNVLLSSFPRYLLHGNLTLLAALAGINMTHYYLDSKIWRTRDDKELVAALRLLD